MRSKKRPSRSRTRGLVMKQIPLDTRGGYVSVLTYKCGSNALYRTIAMNSTTVGTYAAGVEYWYTRSNASGSAIALSSTTQSGYTQASLDKLHGGYTDAFTWTQALTAASWTTGSYTPTQGTTAKLYKAPDPDDANAQIGLLTEQDGSNKLTRAVWYKTVLNASYSIWLTNPTTLDFTQVLDNAGAPSTNPLDIANTTWHYVAS